MSSLEELNRELLDSFTKFKEERDYEKHLEKLKDLSRLRVLDVLKMGELDIPDIGPDPEIENFSQNLDGWNKISKLEVKFMIKIYQAGEIETPEEATVVLGILKKAIPGKEKLLQGMEDSFRKGVIEDVSVYSELLGMREESSLSLLLNSLFQFFISHVE